MELVGYEEDKENTFHCSHTHRSSWYTELTVTSLSIDRPETCEHELRTRYYSEIDDYLIANKHRVDYWTSVSRHGHRWIPLTVSHEELIEQLESVCVKKTTEYQNWDNTVYSSYYVPSTYEIDTLGEKKEAAPVRYSLVDGKLYDRNKIYHFSALANTWQPICDKCIPLPVFKTTSGKIDAKIAPLPIVSITSIQERYKSYESPGDRGHLHHDSPWQWSHSLSVSGDVIIDLGQPKIVTHVGTLGSFIKTKYYPEHLYEAALYPDRLSKRRYRRKFNQGILVEDDQSDQSWCVSYRLMYKRSAFEPYEYAGSYKANQNSYELVVNDVRANLPSVPIRYLMLKPVSNKPRNFPWYSVCRMCISVYGKVPDAVPSLRALESKNEVQLIKYTLCVPSAKPVRFKEGRNWDFWDWGDNDSKHILKQRVMNEITREKDDFYNDTSDWSPLLYNDGQACAGPGYCSICDMLEEEKWNASVSSSFECSDYSSWHKADIDTRLNDVTMWPPLPASTSRKVAERNENENNSVLRSHSGDSEVNSDGSDGSSSYAHVPSPASFSSNEDETEWEYL